ncbi:MAG: cation diffusion facilitator family transporter [Ignavibacteriales bacterium]|nr:cation diffusion facilitator family transporter [Ignavibacteriales bacterium]
MTVDSPMHALKSKHLAAAIVLNAVIFLVEIVGGVMTNSMALISDALHNFSDLLALALSYAASKIVLWKSNSQKSYGYGRIEILVAFINAAALVIIGLYVVYEGVRRFADPQVVNGTWMLSIASFAFVANTAGTLLLKQHAHADLNMKSAYLHLLTDAVESIGVVVVAAMIAWQGWQVLDPLISIGIGAFIIKSGWDVVSETTHLLAEGTPRGIDLDEVARFMQSFPGVREVHHVHIWGLSSHLRALSAHIVVEDQRISEATRITSLLEHALEEKFGINHPTFQLECSTCPEQGVVVDAHHESREHNHLA